jgi:hypothetical protein
LTIYISTPSGFPSCHGTDPWIQQDYSFDGTLVVAGDTLRYKLPEAQFFGTPVDWVMQRVSNQLSGTATGATSDPSGKVSAIFLTRDVIVGTADNQGRFTGVFSGGMSQWHFGFPCDVTTTCTSSAFVWALAPR